MTTMIYVPKKIRVKFEDSENQTITRTLLSNKEYEVLTKDGTMYYGTILEVTEGENPELVFDITMMPGYMNVMKNSNLAIPVADIDEINPITTKYVRTTRSLKEITSRVNTETITFEFSVPKFDTPYKISIGLGEFVALSVVGKEVNGVPGKPISLYGHILGADTNERVIKFRRYISNKGSRKIIDTDVNIDKIVGVYRQNLEIETDYRCEADEEIPTNPVVASTDCKCEDCDGNCNCHE